MKKSILMAASRKSMVEVSGKVTPPKSHLHKALEMSSAHS